MADSLLRSLPYVVFWANIDLINAYPQNAFNIRVLSGIIRNVTEMHHATYPSVVGCGLLPRKFWNVQNYRESFPQLSLYVIIIRIADKHRICKYANQIAFTNVGMQIRHAHCSMRNSAYWQNSGKHFLAPKWPIHSTATQTRTAGVKKKGMLDGWTTIYTNIKSLIK